MMRVPRLSSLHALLWLGCIVCPLVINGDVSSDLTKLEGDFFAWQLERNPILASDIGNKQYNDKLEDLALDVFDSDRTKAEELLTRAQGLDRRQLSAQHQYSYDILVDVISTFIHNYRWRYYGAVNPVSFLEGFYLDLDYLISITPTATKKDIEDYIGRLHAFPRQIAQMKDRMDQAFVNKTTYYNVSVIPVAGQISAVTSKNVEDSPLYRPFNTSLDNLDIPQGDKDSLRTQGKAALQGLWTALDGLKTYMQDTYLSKTRDTFGVEGLPDGRSYYEACLKWHISVDLTPEQVHQKGLQEVERITQEMNKVMSKEGFSGSISEFYDKMNADPQFKLGSSQAILDRYNSLINDRITPQLPKFFKNIPDSNIQVKPLSYDGPYGMYMSGTEDGSRPGIFYVNLFRPNDTKTFSMVSLTLHEALPGHHMQAIYQMAGDLPQFQKYPFFSSSYSIPYAFPFYNAYVEGWALYAEYLGEEMGVYHDDYELMGRYSDEMFRACRLVVDTGLHYKGWSRDRAIQYMNDRTSMSLNEIEIEIDRYLTWPGQACSYKIGEMKIKELRQKASDELGDKFDLREFHYRLLKNGNLPLRVMENIVDDYIHDTKATGGASGLHCISVSCVGLCLFLASLLGTFAIRL